MWRLSFIGLEDLLRLYYVEVIMGIDEILHCMELIPEIPLLSKPLGGVTPFAPQTVTLQKSSVLICKEIIISIHHRVRHEQTSTSSQRASCFDGGSGCTKQASSR